MIDDLKNVSIANTAVELEPVTDRPTTLTESARMMVDQHARDLADALLRFTLEAQGSIGRNIDVYKQVDGRYHAALQMAGNCWQASGATVSDALANALQAYYLR